MSSDELFSFSERAGLLFTIEGSLLSVLAVTFILGFALVKWLRRTITTWGQETPADASDSSLFLNLMVADLIQAIGCLLNFRWMAKAGVTNGQLCKAQAALKQVGIVGVSMSSLCIALHTFAVLVLRWMPPRHASKMAVIFIWTFAAVVIGIPHAVHKNDEYYGPTTFWCWILPNWRVEQIVTEYLWVWFSALSMLVLYTLMFCVMKGWISIGRGLGDPLVVIDSTEPPSPTSDGAEQAKRTKAIANLMLYFPAVYIVTIVPNSIARWSAFNGNPPPPELSLFANTIFALSGLFNFILFLLTRPRMVVGKPIVLVHDPESQRHSYQTPKRSYSDTSTLGYLPDRRDESQSQLDMHTFSPSVLRSPVLVTLPSSVYSTSSKNPDEREQEQSSCHLRKMSISSGEELQLPNK
ncbi:hypothetical protein CPB83DRAFT_862794 [Crepidotus variabilis]|uniref:Glucose receptor Git3 N-terminal domain-containing protein n=1 Tax=Crepidotus variabilis TaxID=179855 RepID=A0A9P6E6Q8_9AGAR|nr:hypothetical protein CPB83DRAFT_862794 [Crepidotus variabilis]